MIEGVLDEMKTVLETHLPAELDKQDGHAADEITCDDINSYLIGDATPTSYGLPAVVLTAESMEGTLWATGKKDVAYSISIGVCVTDTDEDISQRKLWRTMRAVETVLEVHLPGREQIIDYKTAGMEFHASLFEIQDGRSTEKGGIIRATVTERLDSYTASQV